MSRHHIFFQEGDFVFVHPDAVVCGVEIKTNLGGIKQFHESINNLVSLKELANRRNKKGNIGAMLFAYDGSKFPPRTAGKWYKAYGEIKEGLYPELIVVLNKSMLQFRPSSRTQGFGGHYPVLGEGEEYGIRCLSVLLTVVRKYAELSAGKRANPFGQALIEDLWWAKQVLQFGKGVLETPNA